MKNKNRKWKNNCGRGEDKHTTYCISSSPIAFRHPPRYPNWSWYSHLYPGGFARDKNLVYYTYICIREFVLLSEYYKTNFSNIWSISWDHTELQEVELAPPAELVLQPMIFTSNGQRFIQLKLSSSFHLSFSPSSLISSCVIRNVVCTTFVAVMMRYLSPC